MGKYNLRKYNQWTHERRYRTASSVLWGLTGIVIGSVSVLGIGGAIYCGGRSWLAYKDSRGK